MAVYLTSLKHSVALVARDTAEAAALQHDGENKSRLPGVSIQGVKIALPDVAAAFDVVIMAVPSHAMSEAAAAAKVSAPVWISLAKGIRLECLETSCEALEEILPMGTVVASLAGPSHAESVARGLPCALVLSGTPADKLTPIQEAFSSPKVRVYLSSDRRGAELGGALKNVFAVAAGVADALKVGDNAKAALLTRALAEMSRLGVALGGQLETFYGLTGAGDLMATSYGPWSRNRQLGEQVALGVRPEQLIEGGLTAEGFRTSLALRELAQKKSVDAPIVNEVAAILHEGRNPSESMARLMGRPLKKE